VRLNEGTLSLVCREIEALASAHKVSCIKELCKCALAAACFLRGALLARTFSSAFYAAIQLRKKLQAAPLRSGCHAAHIATNERSNRQGGVVAVGGESRV